MKHRTKLLTITTALALALLAGCGGEPTPTDAMKERYETGCKLVDQKFAELEAAMRKEMGKDASKSWANEMQNLPDMCTDGKLDKKKVGEWVTPFSDPAQYEDESWDDEDGDYIDGTESSGELHSIGEEVAWPSGATITVKKLETFTPQYEDVDGTAIKFTIVLNNSKDESFDPSGMYVTVVSGDSEAEEIYDDGVGDYPESPLRPGDVRKFTVGFDVQDPGDVTINVSPDMMTTEAWAN